MTVNDEKHVVGIDFGAISSGISVAAVSEPSVKFTVNKWEENSNDTGPKQFLTSILYKCNGEIICGLSNTDNDKALRSEGDVYINNIKQYISNIDQANEELEQMIEGLTIQKVVTDYLKIFYELAVKCIKNQFDIDLQSDCVYRYSLACPSSQKDFMAGCFVAAGIIEEEEAESKLVFVTEVEATAYHCINLDRQITKIAPYQNYFVCDIGHSTLGISKIETDSTEQFSNVQIISEELGQGSMNLEQNFRNYLTENKSKLNLNQGIIDTLVEEFTDDTKFIFGTPQTKKEDIDDNEASNENNQEEEGEKDDEDGQEEDNEDSDNHGDSDDDDDAYDEEEVEEEELREMTFKKRETVSKTSSEVPSQPGEITYGFKTKNLNNNLIQISYKDLEDYVFSPYINYIIDLILNIDEARIFLSGRYSSASYFYDKLTTAENERLLYYVSLIENTNIDAVSLGALLFGLKVKDVQSPFFIKSSSNISVLQKEEELVTSEEYDFIVGIDFGTTFTGCSYANRKKPGDKIETIETGWPGGNAIKFGKTPTLLTYDKKMKTKYWGQDAKIYAEREKDLVFLSNFKLFLCPEAVGEQYGKGNEDIAKIKDQNYFRDQVENEDFIVNRKKQLPYILNNRGGIQSVNAVKVIADYLEAVKDHVIKYILDVEGKKNGFFGNIFRSKCKFQFVLTVPAMWTIAARETMAKAAILAKIINKKELKQLLIISEPEAAALFCENKYSELILDPDNPQASHFVVCDAGGGTVDLVTFALGFDKDNKPMIHPIGVGSGDTCGSTYLDDSFQEYLLQFYKDMGLDVTTKNTNFSSVMDDFIYSGKLNFMPDSINDKHYVVKLPTERRILSIPDNDKAKKYRLIEANTKLKVKYEDIKEKVFDPIIARILKLIKDQLSQAAKLKRKINAIILVGGFSRNRYLQQRVKDEFKGICKVGIPEEGIAAISHGAVSYGLNPRLISKKMAGQSIALEVQTRFDKSTKDLLVKKVTGPDGDDYSKNRLEYFVERSQQLDNENQEICCKTVCVEYPNSVLIAIFSCDYEEESDKNNWRYVSNMHSKIFEEVIQFPVGCEDLKGELIEFEVSLKMDPIGVTITIECKDSRINDMVKKTSEKPTWKIVRKCKLVVLENRKPLIEISLKNSSYALSSSK